MTGLQVAGLMLLAFAAGVLVGAWLAPRLKQSAYMEYLDDQFRPLGRS